VRQTDTLTEIKLRARKVLHLRPFIYLRENDDVEFIPSIADYRVINKVFVDRGSKEIRRIRIHPPYQKSELVHVPPFEFEIVFRERRNARDWEQVKELERFHYRGMGLNKIVGRRTVLIAEMKGFGVVGYGVLSASLAVASPRFKLLGTNFGEQMRNGIINQIVRVPRIVIHPEYRGLNLGVLMAKHLVQYAKGYWDINHYAPKMIEVVAAMTEYHKFFEKAGFVRAGYTSGYQGRAIIPRYGNGSFEARDSSRYHFMRNQSRKPYLVYPLSREVERRLQAFREERAISILPKKAKLQKPLKFENLSLKYKIRNGSTKRTEIVKEVFGVDVQHAFSRIFDRLSLSIEPGDVVLVTGASGSGKSTLLKLFTSTRRSLRKNLEWHGTFPKVRPDMFRVLDMNFDASIPLIDQIDRRKDIKYAIRLLNSVALTEAHLYIKRPNQISDGQKYRFAIAKLCDSRKPIWIADEFLSTLNPEIAAVVAKGFRKVAYRNGATLVLAAPHISNFAESLLPNKLLRLSWGARPRLYSIKMLKYDLGQAKVSLRFLNNGFYDLNNIQIGLVSMNGQFIAERRLRSLKPRQPAEITLEIKNPGDWDSVIIRSREGVGEVLYKA
jgi:hypothetical protein